MGRRTLQAQAVDRLMNSSEQLYRTFASNYADSSRHRQLVDSAREADTDISKRLTGFTKPDSNLRPAMLGPKNAYSQFVSVWNSGQGDATRSYNQLAEYWTLLDGARSEIQRLIDEQVHDEAGPDQGETGGGPNAADVERLSKVLEMTAELEEMLRHNMPEGNVQRQVMDIREALGGDFSAQTVTELRAPMNAWNAFYEGRKVRGANPVLLTEFKRLLQGAIKNLSQPVASGSQGS